MKTSLSPEQFAQYEAIVNEYDRSIMTQTIMRYEF